MREVSVRVTVDLKLIVEDTAEIQEILENVYYEFHTDDMSSASIVDTDMWDYEVLKDKKI
jgi:hypothetical protein